MSNLRAVTAGIGMAFIIAACSSETVAPSPQLAQDTGSANGGTTGSANGGTTDSANGGTTDSANGGAKISVDDGGAPPSTGGRTGGTGGALGSGREVGELSGGAPASTGGVGDTTTGGAKGGGSVGGSSVGNGSGGTSANVGGNTGTNTGGASANGGRQTSGGTGTNTGGASANGGRQTSGGTEGEGGGAVIATGGAQSTGGASTVVGSQGERYPFPQNVKYPYGLQSTKITSDHVKTWYDSWSKKYLQQCNGNLRPGVDPLSKSLVEAQGFAMVAAAYMGDKEVFDKLYNYYKAKCTTAGCGLMGWKNSCDGWEDQGAATDGDVDVASGLVVANWQWPGSGYDDKAKAVLANLKKVVLDCSGKLTLYPGCSGGRPWGGCNETDISYYSPAFFRYFGQLSGDSSWTKLADDTHIIRDAAANSSTGLVPDWQSVSGTAGAGSRKGYYSFDAMRAPYKQALDFLWNGNAKALTWCKKITSWAYGVGVQNLKDGYQLNGTVQGSSHNLAVVGSLAVASMANTQEVLDAFVAESVKLKDDYWYSGYLGTLYLLALSGNMWNPEIVNSKL